MNENNSLPHHHEGHSEEKLVEQLPDSGVVSAVAEALGQLGDPSRLQIFWILCHCEACVTNLAAMVNMTTPAVSHHLRVLKAGNLVSSRRDGKEMHYSASDTPLVRSLHRTIEEIGRITCPGKE